MTKYTEVDTYNWEYQDYLKMKTRSAKAKGHKLEYLVRDLLLEMFEKYGLTEDDIRANIGSETGEDLKFSQKAKDLLPIKIECKSRAQMAIYTYYDQAKKHPGDDLEPLVVVKKNNRKPLVVMDLRYFLEIFDLYLTDEYGE